MRIITNLALAAVLAFPVVAAQAQTTSTPAQATQSQPAKQGKTVKFTLQNTTQAPISLSTGSQQVTLAAGQSKTVKAPAGTKIVTTTDSSNGPSGTVVAEVSDGMDGATVNVR